MLNVVYAKQGKKVRHISSFVEAGDAFHYFKGLKSRYQSGEYDLDGQVPLEQQKENEPVFPMMTSMSIIEFQSFIQDHF